MKNIDLKHKMRGGRLERNRAVETSDPFLIRREVLRAYESERSGYFDHLLR